jgi:hypothetical protein
MILRGKPKELLGKTNPSETLFDTNSTWTDVEKNMGLSGENTVTNRLVYGTTYMNLIKHVSIECFGNQNQFFLPFFCIVSKFIQVSYSCIHNSKYINDSVENKSCQTSFSMYITSPISSFLQIVNGQIKSNM